MRDRSAVAGIIFDKDGTLFGFESTWAPWTADLLRRLAAGDAARLRELGAAIGFDPQTGRFRPESPVIAGTPETAARCLAPLLPDWPAARLEALMAREAAAVVPVPAVPLGPLIDRLRTRGLSLGVVTNDSAEGAAAQLAAADLAGRFDFVAGYDSGHGAKPDPAPLRAFARAVGLAPQQVAMVGDSLHDLHAARAAGMRAVGVLTGPAEAATLAPAADAVLPDIGHLEAWLAAEA